MNANRNLIVDFRINGEHDHYIEPKKGRNIKKRPTKKRNHISLSDKKSDIFLGDKSE